MPIATDTHHNILAVADHWAEAKSSSRSRVGATLVEISLVATAVMVLIKLASDSAWGRQTWFAIPGVLFVAALAPMFLLGRKPVEIGLRVQGWAGDLWRFLLTCLLVLPGTFLLLGLMVRWGVPLPASPQVEGGQWASWMIYQLLYVAVGEELFFRGYLLGQLLEWGKGVNRDRRRISPAVCVIVSAGVFALAHVVLQGAIISGLTFFPGLVFGWLFIKSRSLLAPVLFHALANTFYAIAFVLLS